MGMNINTKLPMYPATVFLEVSHSDYHSMQFNRRRSVREYLESFVHSAILDENEEGQFHVICNDLVVVNEGINEEHIPDFLVYETYFDFTPTFDLVMTFPIKGLPPISIDIQFVEYAPSTGETTVFCEYQCNSLQNREKLVQKCLRSGWRLP